MSPTMPESTQADVSNCDAKEQTIYKAVMGMSRFDGRQTAIIEGQLRILAEHTEYDHSTRSAVSDAATIIGHVSKIMDIADATTQATRESLQLKGEYERGVQDGIRRATLAASAAAQSSSLHAGDPPRDPDHCFDGFCLTAHARAAHADKPTPDRAPTREDQL